jgi:tetratricopeptide (TPR) repeat protein
VTQHVLAAAVAFLAAGVVANAQDQLKVARDLYTSAAYEEALTALTDLQKSIGAAAPLDQIDRYRAFCLFALGRSGEAQTVAESLIKKDPIIELEDASPRIAAMFDDIRKRLLPTLIREQYRSARSTIDRKEFAEAVPQLERAGRMIDAAQRVGAADETIGDLRVLVDGFLELTRAAAGPSTQSSRPPCRRAANPESSR